MILFSKGGAHCQTTLFYRRREVSSCSKVCHMTPIRTSSQERQCAVHPSNRPQREKRQGIRLIGISEGSKPESRSVRDGNRSGRHIDLKPGISIGKRPLGRLLASRISRHACSVTLLVEISVRRGNGLERGKGGETKSPATNGGTGKRGRRIQSAAGWLQPSKKQRPRGIEGKYTNKNKEVKREGPRYVDLKIQEKKANETNDARM